MRIASAKAISFIALLSFMPKGATAQTSFSAPVRLSDGTSKFQLSRISNGQLAWDEATGTLHATYWQGGLSTLPATPSRIWYQSWTPMSGWASAENIDESFNGPDRIGGRHSSIAIDGNGDVWIAWHDQRHGTSGGNWIDNNEVYADRKAPGGPWITGDLRVTITAAGHDGDSAYVPRLALEPDGGLSLAWYDFHADPNGDVSDVYLKTTDGSGIFDNSETMASMQVTDFSTRGGVSADPFILSDLAITPDGTRHLAWTSGYNTPRDLFHAAIPAGATVPDAGTLIATAASDQLDPPHITAAANGDVWITYGDDSLPGAEDVVLLRMRSGNTSFDAPINVSNNPAVRQYSADAEVDTAGIVHLVWRDDRAGRAIRYGRFDPVLGALVEDTAITTADANWLRPTIELSPAGRVFIAFEEDRGLSTGDVWFAMSEAASAAGNAWQLLE